MFFLALRHLAARKKQTALIALGIVLGAAAYVIISGIMLGFQEFLTDQLVNNDSHIRIAARKEIVTAETMGPSFYPNELAAWISPPSGRKDNSRIDYLQGWIDRLEHEPRVVAYSPQLAAQVLFRRAKATVPGKVIGTDPERQRLVTTLADSMVEGDFDVLQRGGNRIILGQGLARELGSRVGETVLLSIGEGSPTPFKIAGLFKLGLKTIDDTMAYAHLRDVQRLNKSPSRVSDLVVRLNDYRKARELTDQWALLSPDKVESWDQSNQSILSVFKTQDIVRLSMTMAILIVAAFGIYNILSILVNQKKRDIAILRSMGFEASDISQLFFVQGLLLGLAGGLLGLLLGHLACRYIETIPVDVDRIGKTGFMMVSYSLSIYVQGFLLALGSSIFASYLPSRSASKLTPISIIRSESE